MDAKLQDQFNEVFKSMPSELKEHIATELLAELPRMVHNMPREIIVSLEEQMTELVLSGRKALAKCDKELREAKEFLDERRRTVQLAEEALIAINKVL